MALRADSIDVVTNRHEAYAPDEVRAVLSPGGRTVTQQAGGEDEVEWEALFGAVVHYHRLIPWFVPGFDPLGVDRPALEAIHDRIRRDGPLVRRSHRYWFVVRPR